MGFNPNSSDTQIIKEGKLYTGLANMKVVAINPTKAELEAMGYRPQNDPVYLSSEEEVKKVRLDLHVSYKTKEGEVRSKLAFFLENKDRVNQAGDKAEWINDFGATAWGQVDTAPTGLKWFDPETARPAKVGEGELHKFLVNWLNTSKDDEARLDLFERLFDGNYEEMNSLIKGNANNEVRLLLTVREGKYQSVYNRFFDRASNKRTTYWESHIKKQTNEGYPPKEDFQSNLTFQEWKEPSTILESAVSDDGQTIKDDPF